MPAMSSMLLVAAAAARVAIVDVGAEPAGPPARMAIEGALRGSSVGDAALRDAMFGMGQLDRARAEGGAALERARVAFADAKCEQAEKDLEVAERELGQLAAADVAGQMTQIYRYRHGCATQ